MNLSRLAKTLLMATACSAAIAACGDDDGGTGGGAGGGVGGGAGGGVGGGAGGGTASTVSINIRFAQLIPDPQNVAGPDAGVVNPGIRVCLRPVGATEWAQPIPPASQSPDGIPPGALTAYSNIPTFPNTANQVAVYLADQLDAAGGTNPCSTADTNNLPTVVETTIDPGSGGLTNNGYYTAMLTGLVTGDPATLGGAGLVPCFDETMTPTVCPGPAMVFIPDDLSAPTSGNVKVRVINGIPNSGPIELCVGEGAVVGGDLDGLDPMVPSAVPVETGEVTVYESRAPVGDGNYLVAAQRAPAVGDAGSIPCSGATAATQLLWRAVSTVNTPAAILTCGGGGCPTGTAPFATNFAAGDVITVFLTGLVDTNAGDANGLGTPIIPVLDEALP